MRIALAWLLLFALLPLWLVVGTVVWFIDDNDWPTIKY